MDVPQVPPGKSILRVEAPGGYSDRFLLEPLGCVNVGGFFKPSNGKAAKGHYPVRKKKSGMVLSPLIKANPDVIIITGDVFAVQKALSRTIMKNPALAAVPAIKNLDIYSLPFYADSSVI
jgi:ABC-type Fe3+-hydroxamate transport system substrate-binding protein